MRGRWAGGGRVENFLIFVNLHVLPRLVHILVLVRPILPLNCGRGCDRGCGCGLHRQAFGTRRGLGPHRDAGTSAIVDPLPTLVHVHALGLVVEAREVGPGFHCLVDERTSPVRVHTLLCGTMEKVVQVRGLIVDELHRRGDLSGVEKCLANTFDEILLARVLRCTEGGSRGDKIDEGPGFLGR